MAESRLRIMDLTIRDGQQSLWATRMSIGDMIPILPVMDDVGYWAIEAWGGATFDTCMRFLDENPWERLRQIKSLMPKTKLAMLVRGQNLVGYRHYSTDIVNHFIDAAHRNGIEVFRVFDALNDIDNMRDSCLAVKRAGAHLEPAISYTTSPVHTLDSYVDYACQLKELGADTLCIKDMAGLLTPYRTERLVRALEEATGLPIHLHCHYAGGMAIANYIKAAEAGAAIVDTDATPLAFGTAHPAVETIVAAFKESPRDTGLNLDTLFEISNYWEEVRKRGHYRSGTSTLMDVQVFRHQVPGGMMSNLISQLEGQHAIDRLDDVVEEIPRVRAEVGYPPLVTPTSQIVGTQAVMNVITGRRWSLVSKEMRDYLMGFYGKAPAPINPKVLDKVFDTHDPDEIKWLAQDEGAQTYEEAKAEIGGLAKSEEEVLMYAMFPQTAETFLSKHPSNDSVDFLNEDELAQTKEDTYVDMNQIRELIRTVEESSIGEITIKEAGQEINVRKPTMGAIADVSAAPETPGVPTATATPVAQPEPAAPDASAHPGCIPVPSPIVGTFYAAPSPDDDPFVAVGDEVTAGQTLCIVEAMKLMNEIPSPEMGTVREVCVKDGDPVEYGQTLVWLETKTTEGQAGFTA